MKPTRRRSFIVSRFPTSQTSSRATSPRRTRPPPPPVSSPAALSALAPPPAAARPPPRLSSAKPSSSLLARSRPASRPAAPRTRARPARFLAAFSSSRRVLNHATIFDRGSFVARCTASTMESSGKRSCSNTFSSVATFVAPRRFSCTPCTRACPRERAPFARCASTRFARRTRTRRDRRDPTATSGSPCCPARCRSPCRPRARAGRTGRSARTPPSRPRAGTSLPARAGGPCSP